MIGCRNLRKKKAAPVESNEIISKEKKQKLDGRRKVSLLEDKENIRTKKLNPKVLTTQTKLTTMKQKATSVESKEISKEKKQKLDGRRKVGLLEDKENIRTKKLNPKVLTTKTKLTTMEQKAASVESKEISSKEKKQKLDGRRKVGLLEDKENIRTKKLNPKVLTTKTKLTTMEQKAASVESKEISSKEKKQKLDGRRKVGLLEDKENIRTKKLNPKVLTTKAKLTTMNQKATFVESNEVISKGKKRKLGDTKKVSLVEDKENIGTKKLNSKILTSKVKSTRNILQEKVSPQNDRQKCKAKIDVRKTNTLEKVPIWKKNLNLTKSELAKKRAKNIDIYDISLDEDLQSSKTVTKVKTVKHLKGNIKSKVIKKKPVPNLTQMNMKQKSVASLNNNTDKLLQINETAKQILPSDDIPVISSDLTKDIPVVSSDLTNLQNKNKEQSSDPNELIEDDITVIYEDCAVSDVLISKSVPQDNHTFLLQFADEFESSFLLPKMTSTPSENVRIKKHAKLNQNVANVSYTHCMNKETISTAISHDPPAENVPVNDKDINLFESPSKSQKVLKQGVIKFKSQKKPLQINLFDEDFDSPSSPNQLEESVLQPKKAYHTPDNFKISLERAKRSAAIKKKAPIKTKQDIMIEKLVKHFDDISDMELCIE